MMKKAEYRVTLNPDKIKNATSVREPVMWCVDTFGGIGPRWDWTIGNHQGAVRWIFYFSDKSDFMQFTLAWR